MVRPSPPSSSCSPPEGTDPRTTNPTVTATPTCCAASCSAGSAIAACKAQQNHGAPYYRCRFPDEYALANRVSHPRNVYLREDELLPTLDRWLGKYFARHRRADTIGAILAAQGGDGEDAVAVLARETITECDRKLGRYRATLEALDHSTDPAIVAGWITETQLQRNAAEAKLRRTPRQATMTRDQITSLVDHLGDQATAIAGADPAQQTVRAEARLSSRTAWENGLCPRGDTNQFPIYRPAAWVYPVRCRLAGREGGGLIGHGGRKVGRS